MPFIFVFISHWYISLFMQTFFLHRYASHGYYTLSKRMENFFTFLTYLAQGSSYLSPHSYGILHMAHHSYSDTEKDPHSPKFHSNPWIMMYHTANTYEDILASKHKLNSQFTPFARERKKFDQFGNSWASRILWGAFYVAFYVAFAPSAWYYFLIPLHFVMGPIHGAIVNWFGHKRGYRNFSTPDHSTNTLPMDFLMLGELYQNNHHQYPNAPKFSKRSWEIDLVWPIMKVMHFFKIIKITNRSKEQSKVKPKFMQAEAS